MGRRLRNERDVLRVFYLRAVDTLSALFITDDLVCGVGGGGERTGSPPLKSVWAIQTRDHRRPNIFIDERQHIPYFWCFLFFFYHDAMNGMARLAHSCPPPPPDLGREGGDSILGFLYEPRGPVSYPTQFFFWEDLQNAFFLGQRMSPGLELASGA